MGEGGRENGGIFSGAQLQRMPINLLSILVQHDVLLAPKVTALKKKILKAHIFVLNSVSIFKATLYCN